MSHQQVVHSHASEIQVPQLTREINEAFDNVHRDMHNLSAVLTGIHMLNAKGVNTGDAAESLQAQIDEHYASLERYFKLLCALRDEMAAKAAEVDDHILDSDSKPEKEAQQPSPVPQADLLDLDFEEPVEVEQDGAAEQQDEAPNGAVEHEDAADQQVHTAAAEPVLPTDDTEADDESTEEDALAAADDFEDDYDDFEDEAAADVAVVEDEEDEFAAVAAAAADAGEQASDSGDAAASTTQTLAIDWREDAADEQIGADEQHDEHEARSKQRKFRFF